METVGISRAGAGKIGAAKTRKKVATTKTQLGKKIVTLELCNFLPIATINGGVIAKLEKG